MYPRKRSVVMPKNKCPICKKKSGTLKTNKTFPFCSTQCKTIDLGKWVSEEYKVETGDDTSLDEVLTTEDDQ